MSKLAFQDLQFHEAVLEVRYPRAHKYWDDCGKLVSELETKLPGLACQRLDENGFQFQGHADIGVSRASFYWDRVSMYQDLSSGLSKFGETAEEFWRLVAFVLEIRKVSRLGHRLWHYLPTKTVAEAVNWLAKQKVWMIRSGAWGIPVNSGVVLRTRIEPEDRNVRIEIDAAESKSQNKPTITGVLIDVDFSRAVVMDTAKVDIREFIRRNHKLIEQSLAELLSEGQ